MGWEILLQHFGQIQSVTFMVQGNGLRRGLGPGPQSTGSHTVFSLEATMIASPPCPAQALPHRQQLIIAWRQSMSSGGRGPRRSESQAGLPFKIHFLSEDLPLSP